MTFLSLDEQLQNCFSKILFVGYSLRLFICIRSISRLNFLKRTLILELDESFQTKSLFCKTRAVSGFPYWLA